MSRKLATVARGGVLAAITLLVAMPMTSTAFAQRVGDIVATEPVTEFDIEQRSKFNQLATRKAPSRQEVIDELRDEKLKIREATKSGLEITEAMVDSAYAAMASRMNLTPAQLTMALARSDISSATLKHRIRADIAAQWKNTRSRQNLPSWRE